MGKSTFWDSTAIFVQWDDWGGLYDHVPPAYLNFDSVGFRVPLLVISPYAKSDFVSHVHYETASVLRFAEDVYGLNRLAAADKRAASPGSQRGEVLPAANTKLMDGEPGKGADETIAPDVASRRSEPLDPAEAVRREREKYGENTANPNRDDQYDEHHGEPDDIV